MLRTRAPLTIASPFDLHVLGPPQTFALSQDQTLQFELCSIMIEDSLEPSTGCRCRSSPLSQQSSRPDGVWTRSPRTHKRHVLVSLFHYPVFRERLAPAGAVRGVGDLCSLSHSVKFFLAGVFSLAGCWTCVWHPPSPESDGCDPRRSSGFSFGLLSEAGGPGGSKGGGVYPLTLFPVKRFFAGGSRCGCRKAEAPRSPKRRTRLSPNGSARQDQFS